jgi:hypothetical protein
MSKKTPTATQHRIASALLVVAFQAFLLSLLFLVVITFSFWKSPSNHHGNDDIVSFHHTNVTLNTRMGFVLYDTNIKKTTFGSSGSGSGRVAPRRSLLFPWTGLLLLLRATWLGNHYDFVEETMPSSFCGRRLQQQQQLQLPIHHLHQSSIVYCWEKAKGRNAIFMSKQQGCSGLPWIYSIVIGFCRGKTSCNQAWCYQ